MKKLILIALLSLSPLAMAEESYEPYRVPDYAGQLHRQTERMYQEDRLRRLEDQNRRIENRQQQEDWDRINRNFRRSMEGKRSYED